MGGRKLPWRKEWVKGNGTFCLKNQKRAQVPSSVKQTDWLGQSWALLVFLNFFNNKKWFFCIFYEVNDQFLNRSYLKSPLPVKLTWWKMKKIILCFWTNSKMPKVPKNSDKNRPTDLRGLSWNQVSSLME